MAQICPSADELRAYARGELSLPEHTAVESHLDECGTCSETVAAYDGTQDTFLAGLPAASVEFRMLYDPELQLLASRAKSLIGGTGDHGPTSESSACTNQQPAIPQGTVLSNYVVGELLGSGNMGFVYRAYHQRMKRDVALKFIQPALMTSKEARQRFQREIEATARLSHPNIVAAYDADEVNGHLFFVQELVEGTDLRELVKQSGPLLVSKALDYVSQAARGLQYVHAKGILHRDIKPSNLLLDTQDCVKVADLGLARIQRFTECELDQEATKTGFIAGTPAFMSPEQRDNLNSADQRSDVYSLGCTLYYLLTGTTVSQTTPSDQTLLLPTSPSVRTLRPDCPVSVDELVHGMMALEAKSRPQSMREVLQAIEALPRVIKIEHGSRSRKRTNVFTLPTFRISVAALIVLCLAFAVAKWWPGQTANQGDVANAESSTARSSGQANSSKPAMPNIELVRIRSGEFQMGSPEDDENAELDEQPQHRVTISRSFLLGKYEITIDQYADVMDLDEREVVAMLMPDARIEGFDTSIPVAGISWYEAIRFCNRLSERHGFTPFYTIEDSTVTANRGSKGFRLPSEAEWEFACRAGSTTSWCFGDNPELLASHAWFAGNSGGTPHPVGGKSPNAFGLHDMHGNVPEWCWDRYDPDYYAVAEAINPHGATHGLERVFRGGGATSRASQTRSAERNLLGGSYGVLNRVGLRVARSVQK